MSKKSDFKAVSEKEVASVIAALKKVEGPVDAPVAMNATGRLAAPKLRTGAAQVITTLAVIATKHKVEVQGMSLADMGERMVHAERLHEMLGAVNVLQKYLKDAILVSEGDAWKTATTTYSVLRRLAKNQSAIATELAPVIAWFRKPQKAPSPPAAAEPVAPVAATLVKP